MRRISDIATDRGPGRTSRLTATLRSPELAQALNRSGEGLVYIVWSAVSVAILWTAWRPAGITNRTGRVCKPTSIDSRWPTIQSI